MGVHEMNVRAVQVIFSQNENSYMEHMCFAITQLCFISVPLSLTGSIW